jgi:hypothetical protein
MIIEHVTNHEPKKALYLCLDRHESADFIQHLASTYAMQTGKYSEEVFNDFVKIMQGQTEFDVILKFNDERQEK